MKKILVGVFLVAVGAGLLIGHLAASGTPQWHQPGSGVSPHPSLQVGRQNGP